MSVCLFSHVCHFVSVCQSESVSPCGIEFTGETGRPILPLLLTWTLIDSLLAYNPHSHAQQTALANRFYFEDAGYTTSGKTNNIYSLVSIIITTILSNPLTTVIKL